jgi:hypothetical protein
MNEELKENDKIILEFLEKVKCLNWLSEFNVMHIPTMRALIEEFKHIAVIQTLYSLESL